MTVALRSPDLVSAMVAVDNSPVRGALGNPFEKYVQGMKEIASSKVTKQSEADRILRDYEEVRKSAFFSA